GKIRKMFAPESATMTASSLLLLAMAALPASAPPAKAEALSSRAIYDRAVHSTALVSIPKKGTGTGWILDSKRKLLVTNYHVASEGACEIYYPIFNNGKVVSDRRRYTAERAV